MGVPCTIQLTSVHTFLRLHLAHIRPYFLAATALVTGACSDSGTQGDGQNGNGSGAGDSESRNNIDVDLGAGQGDGDGSSSGGGDEACEVASTQAALEPVSLAVAFDVSGSMGKITDSACYDPELKWKPVVAASTAFFESSEADGLRASMGLFPARDAKCELATYETPDVQMQNLPSGAFREVLEAYSLEVSSDKWRGGTPTLYAYQGTLSSLEVQRAKDPWGHFAVVLVTDGKPQGCDYSGPEEILANISGALAEGITTYVVGVKQPTTKTGCEADADNAELQENLNMFASAGGTEAPFMIDTNSPEATEAAFSQAIANIRERSSSCTLQIPPRPGGLPFERDRTTVVLNSSQGTESLPHDPECTLDAAWRYDNEETPTQVELCELLCDRIADDPAAGLEVQFLCEDRVDLVK